MEWQTEEFGSSHEGRPRALLADGTEPGPVYFDIGSGAEIPKSTDWWVYDGTLGAPEATHLRAACTCGWRGDRLYPLDWTEVSRRHPYEYDTSALYEDWTRHISDVESRSVPLPTDIEATIEDLDRRLTALADQAPLAALRAVTSLERVTADAGREAAYNIRADELTWETISKALGLTEDAARSLLFRFSFRR
ncbi:hypothetical protein IAG44_04295 [Streptomyces roseirectus]|uniref:Uncharacterized protein n=1 Tax=Streptomyces roseirectus TaxID=2768066 RepID=A0A7H0I7I9_9ACTN|nr:hypothetical protein [Streptomyces roseirectus]QNP68755.1 hypothetical protein IAG44_04295 [Streptomyces roseirectus]